MRGKVIGLNSEGRRVGESHPNAKLSNEDVELIRELHEEHGMGYKKLSKKFDAPIRTIRDICNDRYRNQAPAILRQA